MNPVVPPTSTDALDELLIDLVDEFGRRVEAGDKLTVESFVLGHPEHAERLRALLPAVQRLAQLGRSQVGRSTIAADLASGSVVGDFTIVREIGRGGMGVVYEAYQDSLGRSVALKVLSRTADAGFLQRFRREARVVAKLHHTNIVPIFGIGEDVGHHFFAMQLIDGDSLDKLLRQARQWNARDAAKPKAGAAAAEAETEILASTAVTSRVLRGGGLDRPGAAGYCRAAAQIGLQVAQGLAYAHEAGVLHRDVKPSNILLDDVGQARISDFGLAKVEGEDALTTTGDVVGTLRYMAPERFSGACDARGDIYGLGATLYELLTLRPIFDEQDRAALLAKILHDAPVPLGDVCPNLPADLRTIVTTAMAHDPARRYQTAAALAEDLQLFLTDRPIRARSMTRIERGWRWCKRYPVLAALAVCLAVSISGGMAGVFWQWQRAEAKAVEASDERDIARKAEREALQAKERSESNLQRARQTVSKLTLTAGEMFRRDGNAAGACKIHEQAAAIHDTFLRENPENTSLLPAAIQQWENVAAIREQLNRLPGAIAAQTRAVELSKRLVNAHPESLDIRTTAISRHNYLARLLAAAKRHVEADAIYRETTSALRDCLALPGMDAALRYRVNISLGRDLLNYAYLQIAAGNDEKALALLGEAIRQWTAIIEGNPSTKEHVLASWLGGLADAYGNARMLQKKANRAAEAKAMLLGEIATRQRLVKLFPANSEEQERRLVGLQLELTQSLFHP